MELLKLSIEAQLTLMEMHKLTPEEMTVIELLFLASMENKKELLIRYSSLPITRHPLPIVLTSLQNKDVILKSFKIPETITSDFDFETIPFNQNFLKRYRKLSGELGAELFNTYPSFAIIGDSQQALKNFAKYFNSMDEFFYAYGKAIGWKQEKHKEVLSLIKWSIDNGGFGLNMNIGAFVVSRMWESIKDFKNKDGKMLTFDTTINI